MQSIVYVANQASHFIADESGWSFTEAMLIALLILVVFVLALLAAGINN